MPKAKKDLNFFGLERLRRRRPAKKEAAKETAAPVVVEKEAGESVSPAKAAKPGKTAEAGLAAEATEQARKKKRRRRKKSEAEPVPEQVVLPELDTNWDPASWEVTPMPGKTRFHDLELPAAILHAVADLGFSYCTPIQAEALPKSLAGADLIGQAQTGTGKTAAFLITLLARFLAIPPDPDREPGRPRALVIAPTRELVIQITKEAQELGKYCPLRVLSVFGGIDYQKQKNDVTAAPVDIMVATPGRLLDFIRQRAVQLDAVEIVVLDEADRMLDMGFIPDVRRIIAATPDKEKRQTLFFSATMTPEVNRLAVQWTRKGEHIEIEPEHVAVDSVDQVVYILTKDDKFNLLYNLITKHDLQRVMVFANRRDETRRLTDRLKRAGISCDMLSGEVSQAQRIKTLENFRSGTIRVLVATDVAGRGIHIDDVSHVVNYTVPYESEDYVHRIGRTGRAGATGTSITFADEEGSFYLPEIEEFIGRSLNCTYPDESLLTPAPKGTAEKVEEKRRSSGRGGSARAKSSRTPRPRARKPKVVESTEGGGGGN